MVKPAIKFTRYNVAWLGNLASGGRVFMECARLGNLASGGWMFIECARLGGKYPSRGGTELPRSEIASQ